MTFDPAHYHWPHVKIGTSMVCARFLGVEGMRDGEPYTTVDKRKGVFRRFEYELYTDEARVAMKQWAREYDARRASLTAGTPSAGRKTG